MKQEIGQPVVEVPKRESRPLTPELGARLFFASYEHSQGDSNLQTEIFLALRNNNPEWRITYDLENQIIGIVRPRIANYLTHSQTTKTKPDQKILHSKIVEDGINDIFPEISAMQEIFESPIPLDNAMYILTTRMIDRDNQFLHQEKGRPRKNVNSKTPKGDPFLSFICYYGLNEHTTGIQELDEIYREINKNLRNPEFLESVPEYKGILKFIVKKYSATHPNDQVKDFPLEELAA